MTRPMVRYFDDNNVQVDREMNDAEFAVSEADRAAWVARNTAEQAQVDTKASAIANLVAGTPLTPEEAATIVL